MKHIIFDMDGVIGKKDERFGYDQSGADYLIKRLTEIVKIIEGGVI